MTPHSLGKITVTTPGTPVQVATSGQAARIHFQATGNTGSVYLGISGMSKPTTGVLKIFPPAPAACQIAPLDASRELDLWSQSQEAIDSQSLLSYWIDADVAGEGLLVSYWS